MNLHFDKDLYPLQKLKNDSYITNSEILNDNKRLVSLNKYERIKEEIRRSRANIKALSRAYESQQQSQVSEFSDKYVGSNLTTVRKMVEM